MDAQVAYFKPLFEISTLLQRMGESSSDDLYARVAAAMSLETYQAAIARLASLNFIRQCGDLIVWSGPI